MATFRVFTQAFIIEHLKFSITSRADLQDIIWMLLHFWVLSVTDSHILRLKHL